MNRSKSDTPRQGDRTASAPAASLTETAASRVEEARTSLLRSPRPDDAGRLARSTQISEILDRQKLLSRNRPPPRRPRTFRWQTRSVSACGPRQLRSRAASARRATAICARANIAPATTGLIHEGATIASPPRNMRPSTFPRRWPSFAPTSSRISPRASRRKSPTCAAKIRDIGATVAEHGYPQDLYADLQRLAEGMEYIGEATENAVTNSVRSELDSIRAMVSGMARQDDLAVIVEHFEALRQQMAETETQAQTRSLDTKIGSLADAIEMLVSQMSNADRDLNSQMHTLDERLAEIVAAIDANAQATADLSGDAGLGSLEARIARLVEELDGVNVQQRDNIVAERIEGLALRMEELAKLQATEHLDRRFDELAALLAQGGAAPAGEDLSAIVSDISRKIDDMARGTVSSELVNRFDDLANRIDSLNIAGATGGLSEEILTWLEGRMNDIAARIDSNVEAKGNPAADLGALEEQIAALTKLLSEPRVTDEINSAQMTSRMSALEDYMSTNDEYIVEAARQAAETALEAYVRNFAGQPSNTSMPQADISTISDLASDLHALEELTRSGEARNQQTFETLQQTLMQIADRLDKLGASTEAAAAAAPAVSKSATTVASRPRQRTGTDTEMFSSDFDDDLFDDDIAVENTATREAGEKPFKGLLSSIGKRFRPNAQEQKAEESRRKVDAAPAIDAADDISPDLANQLLEPGSGAPDIRQILEKVRSVQDGKPVKRESLTAREDDNSDYIAVARRAAQAAAAEVGTAEGAGEAAEASASVVGKYRRPLLLGTASCCWPSCHGRSSRRCSAARIHRRLSRPAVTQPTSPADAATVTRLLPRSWLPTRRLRTRLWQTRLPRTRRLRTRPPPTTRPSRLHRAMPLTAPAAGIENAPAAASTKVAEPAAATQPSAAQNPAASTEAAPSAAATPAADVKPELSRSGYAARRYRSGCHSPRRKCTPVPAGSSRRHSLTRQTAAMRSPSTKSATVSLMAAALPPTRHRPLHGMPGRPRWALRRRNIAWAAFTKRRWRQRRSGQGCRALCDCSKGRQYQRHA